MPFGIHGDEVALWRSSPDAHAVVVLDAATGAERRSFAVRVPPSAPTVADYEWQLTTDGTVIATARAQTAAPAAPGETWLVHVALSDGVVAIVRLPDGATRSGCQLVIFDCDGVLVDSERITNQVFADLLGELGLAFTLEDMFEHFVGNSMAHCLDKVAVLLGQPPPPDFEATYRARSERAFETQLRSVPGIEEALAQIAIPDCVASNGPTHKMRLTLGLTGLLPRFEGRLFSSEDVARPKPAPDLFLHAAHCCGAAPAECVVVEDTPTGVAAAVAAGMTVLGYTALTPAHRLRAAGAHHLFDHMTDLPRLLCSGYE